jgi:tRNA-specific 2-thiouridylase
MTTVVDLELPKGARVVAAMSGGVDSAVSAGLLAEAGYEVVGVTMQLYDHGRATAKSRTCCAGQDIHDARRAAAVLGIPHYVLDYERRFEDDVIRPFARSYAMGETPIPCVLCNQTVKFRDLVAVARDLGAAALATGHYARRAPGGSALLAAADAARDQSYFLHRTTAEQLAYLRFPLGGMGKDEVRGHARRLGLSLAEKPDSQDICFVPDGRHARLVAALEPGAAEPGEIAHVDGRVLGRHDGIANFTVGQRKGLGIADAAPLFVVRIEARTRRVIVGPREALSATEVRLRDVNWVGAAPEAGARVRAKLRARMEPAPARVTAYPGAGAVLEFETPQAGVAPGQAGVLYEGARMLGGGWIAPADAKAA